MRSFIWLLSTILVSGLFFGFNLKEEDDLLLLDLEDFNFLRSGPFLIEDLELWPFLKLDLIDSSLIPDKDFLLLSLFLDLEDEELSGRLWEEGRPFLDFL